MELELETEPTLSGTADLDYSLGETNLIFSL